MTINKEHIYYSHEKLSDLGFPQFIIDEDNILLRIIIDNSTTLETTNLTSKEILHRSLRLIPHIIPIIDENKRMLSSIDNNQCISLDESTYIISKTPAKVSFAGGGSDFTDYLVDGNKGQVLNCAIDLFSTCELKSLQNNEVLIKVGKKEKALSIDTISEESLSCKDFGLILSVLQLLSPKSGISIKITTDFPAGSGLGGSSAVTISILTAFNEAQAHKWSKKEIAYLAFISERILFDITGGWQDQYASTIGGLNEIVMLKEEHHIKNVTNSNAILDELQNHLIITNTGITRNSGSILDHQRKSIVTNTSLLESLNNSKRLVPIMIQNILNSRFDEFSRNLKSSGEIKRKTSNGQSLEKVDKVFDYALEAGVISGRLLGAGSGGHFLFFVFPKDKENILKKLNNKGYQSYPIQINRIGTTAKNVSKN